MVFQLDFKSFCSSKIVSDPTSSKLKMDSTFIKSVEELNTRLDLKYLNDFPQVHYDPEAMLVRLKQKTPDPRQLSSEISDLFKFYYAYGQKNVFLTLRRPRDNRDNREIRFLLKKYGVQRCLGFLHKSEKMTFGRLAALFPHVKAHLHVVRLDIQDANCPQVKVSPALGPACIDFSSFGLLPQHQEDVAPNHSDVLKSMLLILHSEITLEHMELAPNTAYMQSSSKEKFEQLLGTASIFYELSRVSPDLRWLTYQRYLINHPSESGKEPYDYKSLALEWDALCWLLQFEPDLERYFPLKPGRGRTLKPEESELTDENLTA